MCFKFIILGCNKYHMLCFVIVSKIRFYDKIP